MFGRLAATAGLTVGATAIVFGVAAPPERCPSITSADVEAGAGAAVDWIVDNQQPDGSWLYEYDRVADTATDDYNEIRHAGLISSLYQAGARGYPRATDSADLGLGWARDHLVERHGWIGMTDSDTVSTGSNALLLAGLAERRIDTGDDRHDSLMRGLGRFLVAQTEPSGAHLAYYDLDTDQPRAGEYSIYYTGEAYWALARLHRAFPDEGWGDVADRIGDYIATVRDDREDIWPPLADHWAGYGLAETAAFPERPTGTPLTDAEVDYVRRLGGLFGQRVRSISQRFGPWGVAVRGTFTPRGGGYGVFGEGLTGLWRASHLDERLAPERNTLADRAVCIVGLALDAQVDADEAARYPDPDKVRGAWFIDDVTRMDDQQHALSALLMTIPILDSLPEPAGSGHPAPMWLLWFVVVIATIDPPRLVRSAAGVAQPRRWRVLGAALGAGAALMLAVGATSGWLIEALDTSRPAVRLGAAALCLVSAAADFARPRPSPDETAGDGTFANAVASLLPAVARPATLVAGISVVADHSLGLFATALLTTVCTTLAIASVPLDAPERSGAMTWLVRLSAAIALTGSALLIAHAVFDL